MDNKNKKLILTKTDNKYEVKVSPSGTILDILELLGNASLHVMKHCVEEAPEALKETIQKDLYDKYNCIDIDPYTIYEKGIEVEDPLAHIA